MRSAARLALAVLLLAAGDGGEARGGEPYGHPPRYDPYPYPFLCDEEVMIFESLKYGEFDYCRLHLRYQPGRADCLRILLPTCNVFQPEAPNRSFHGSRADWLLRGRGERIVCPPGPPPPSCPAGFPAGPIPRR
jgi:hypothetical protein